MRKFIYALIPIVIIGAIFLYRHQHREANRPTYLTAPVRKGPLVSTVSSSGTLNAVITVQVGSQVSGQIKELLADFNSEVREGQIIARIDPENFKARVLQAEAELEIARTNVTIQKAAAERARAELVNAEAAVAVAEALTEKAAVALNDAVRELNRKRKLFKTTVISRNEIEKVIAAHDQAAAQWRATQAEQVAQASVVKSRKANLRIAEKQISYAVAQVRHREAVLHQNNIDLEHTIIRSPVNGVVIERNVDMGQTVAASLQAPTLFTIAQDLRKMQVETSMDEADIGRIHVGQKATFTVDAFPDKEFGGRVEQIRKSPQTVQNVVTYTVVISTENPDLILLPGMTANVKVVVSERSDTLKVPSAALRFRPADGAQTGNSAGGRPATGDSAGPGPRGTSERIERLIEALGLDENQQARVRELSSNIREKIVAMRQKGAAREEIQAEIKRLRLKNKNAFLLILNPEQKEKLNRIQAARAAHSDKPGRVWIMGPEGKPSPVDVIVGIDDGSHMEIVRGELQEGQMVITGISRSKGRRSGPVKRFGF